MQQHATPKKSMKIWLTASAVILIYSQLTAISLAYLSGVMIKTYWDNTEILSAVSMFGSASLNIRNSIDVVRDEVVLVSSDQNSHTSKTVELMLDDSIQDLEGSFDTLGKKLFNHDASLITEFSKQLTARSIVFEDRSTKIDLKLSFMSSIQLISMNARIVFRVSQELAASTNQSALTILEKRRTLLSSARFILSNSIDDVLPMTLTLLDYIDRSIVQVEIDQFEGIRIQFIIWYIISVVGFSSLYFYWQFCTNTQMYQVIEVYGLLTTQECMLHIKDVEKIERLMIDKKHSESDLLANAMFNHKTYDAVLRGTPLNIRTHRVRPLVRDKLNYTFKTALVCLGVFFGLLFAVGYCLLLASSEISFVFDLEKTYLNHCKATIGLNDRHNYFASMVLYGAVFDSRGNIVKGSSYDSAVKNFSDYWVNNAAEHDTIFSHEYTGIKSLLFDDVCQSLPNKSSFEQFKVSSCLSALGKGSANGLVYFLLDYDENMSSLVDKTNALNNGVAFGQLNISNKSIAAWFDSRILTLNVAFKTVVNFFFKTVESKLNSVANSFIQDLGWWLELFLILSILIMTLVAVSAGALIRYTSSEDWSTCYESFRIFSPRIVASNAYILSTFKRLFDLNY